MSQKQILVQVSTLHCKTIEILTYQIMHLCRQLDHDRFLTNDRKTVKLMELKILIEKRNCLLR